MRLELRQENEGKAIDAHTYVQMISDALRLNKSVCLARHFTRLRKDDIESSQRKLFIDIWPVSALPSLAPPYPTLLQVNLTAPQTSTQFDVTCLYMFQLATILAMVKPWKTSAILRVFLCIDAINENALHAHRRLDDLLQQLRINAQTRMISWDNVTSLLLRRPSPADDRATRVASHDSFVDVSDEYVRRMSELIQQQCDSTACVYLYLPRPPRDPQLSERYIRVLDGLSKDLPPALFVHGVSSVTCTRL